MDNKKRIHLSVYARQNQSKNASFFVHSKKTRFGRKKLQTINAEYAEIADATFEIQTQNRVTNEFYRTNGIQIPLRESLIPRSQPIIEKTTHKGDVFLDPLFLFVFGVCFFRNLFTDESINKIIKSPQFEQYFTWTPNTFFGRLKIFFNDFLTTKDAYPNTSNNGSSNNGSSNNGSKNNGSKNNGSKNNGSKNNGSRNNGSRNNGSRNNGSRNNGSSNNGSSNNGSLHTDSISLLEKIIGNKEHIPSKPLKIYYYLPTLTFSSNDLHLEITKKSNLSNTEKLAFIYNRSRLVALLQFIESTCYIYIVWSYSFPLVTFFIENSIKIFFHNKFSMSIISVSEKGLIFLLSFFYGNTAATALMILKSKLQYLGTMMGTVYLSQILGKAIAARVDVVMYVGINKILLRPIYHNLIVPICDKGGNILISRMESIQNIIIEVSSFSTKNRKGTFIAIAIAGLSAMCVIACIMTPLGPSIIVRFSSQSFNIFRK